MSSVSSERIEKYSAFVMSVDDLEWTKHWLGGLRCDQLVVFVARDANVSPKVRIRAVESKATLKTEPAQLSVTSDPHFAEGVGQVIATLEALWRIISPSGSNALVEDLRFTSFIEHLASVALSTLHPILVTDTGARHVLRCISDLSSRHITPPHDVELDGIVICTQYRSAAISEHVEQEIEGETRSWRVHLVRAGASELDRLLGKQIIAELVEAIAVSDTSEESLEGAMPDLPEESSGPTMLDEGKSDTKLPSTYVVDSAAEVTVPQEEVSVTDSALEVGIQLAKDLYLACLHRGFPVDSPDPDNIVAAPALYAVAMALRAGASIRPIESALDDLAREVGVPSISVENDLARPFHLRFIITRTDRQFPGLPENQAPHVDSESQSYLGLYLGSTLDGRDYNSYISSWPHMLVGGTSGSGKTTFVRSLLRQINRVDARYLKVAVVDGKGEIDYFGTVDSSHFVERFPDIVLGHQNVMPVFEWLINEEIPSRRETLLSYTRSVANQRPRSARELYVDAMMTNSLPMFSPIIVIIDEFAEIMIGRGTGAEQFEHRVQQITQVGRSVLVHLLLATQRPDASVISGTIKANLDARVALRVPTFHDSMTILGTKGAERLTGRGDMIFQASGQPAERLQGYNA
jgi:hypothetical protein